MPPRVHQGSERGSLMLLVVVAIALVLTITNTVAFSRSDKFSQASTYANRAFGGNIVNNLAGGLLGRLFK